MNFSISRNALLPILQVTEAVAKKSKQMPILGHVLIKVSDSQIEISGTDLNTQITATAPLDDTPSGECAFSTPAGKLADLVRLSPDGSTFNFKLEEERLVLSCGKSRYRLLQLPPEQFPAFEAEDDEAVLSLCLPAEVFLTAITRVKFAMGKDDVRFYLNGVNLGIAAGSVVTTASNGHILSHCLTDVGSDPNSEIPALKDSRIFPRNAILELGSMLSRLINQGPSMHIDVLMGARTACITLGNVSLHTKFLDGRYPDFTPLIETSYQAVLRVSSTELKSVIDRSLVIGKEETDSVVIDASPDGAEVSLANQELESINETIPCLSFDGEPTKLAFNGKYLKQAIEQVDGQEIQLSMTPSSLYIGDPVHEGWMALVKPRRT